MPLLEINEITKYFGDRCVLKKVSLSVDENEILLILGPNGAGKTTLLKIVDLIEYPTSGRVTFDGLDVTDNGDVRFNARRNISFVFQQPVLFNMSLFSNIEYPLRIRGHGKARKMVEEVLDLVGLSHLAKANGLSLSGGETQRAAIARALVTKPRLLLLDEPTSNLDPFNSRAVAELVQRIKKNGTAILLTTQNPRQVGILADRVAFLLDGSIVDLCSGKDVREGRTKPELKAFMDGGF